MQTELRKNAEERLKAGSAPITKGWPTGTQALTLLHGLASAPDSASDALKLLHELQVHQVELDLQHEQAEQDHREVTLDLENYMGLFELAPFGYLALDADGRVLAANRIATDWLTPAPGKDEGLNGRRVEELLAPESRSSIRDMLASLRNGHGRQSCALQSRLGSATTQAVATQAPGAAQVLMALLPVSPAAGT